METSPSLQLTICVSVWLHGCVCACCCTCGVSDVMGQQESEVEEELCEDAGDGEEDASDEDYEDCLKNEDEEQEEDHHPL